MVATGTIRLETNPTANRYHAEVIDITPQIEEQVARSGIKDGVAVIFVTGSTAGLTTIEFEPGLTGDFQAMWERLIPQGITYGHDGGEGNGYAHVRASFLGASITVPIRDSKLALGTWQQIVLVDFDNRPRSRQVIVQVMGE